METATIISRANPPTVLLENGSMVHDSNKRGRKRSDRADDRDPLENCSMASWIKPNSNTAKRSVKKERTDMKIEMNIPA